MRNESKNVYSKVCTLAPLEGKHYNLCTVSPNLIDTSSSFPC